jgi:hypothetical protein
MLILFPKEKGVKIATTIIFQEMAAGAGFRYILGMIDFAWKFGAITPEERTALIQYLKERG